MADELDEVKSEVAAGNRALTELGLAAGVRASLGHVSMRVPSDPGRFVVKGRGYRIDVLERMRPEDMVTCDLDGLWVDGPPDSVQCNEIKIHSCIYKARPDVHSVVHVHPDYTVLMSVLGQTLKPMAQEGVQMVLHPIPVFPHTKIIESEEEGREVARLLGNGRAVLLLGHGAVTAGISVEESVVGMALLEHQARLNYLAICAMGVDHPSIPHDTAEAVLHIAPLKQPHFQARVPHLKRQTRASIWPYYRELVSRDM
ncbi:MAG: class II aldolase/adducin family protein [Chloroflexota bacterium]